MNKKFNFRTLFNLLFTLALMMMLTACEGFKFEGEATPLEEEVSDTENLEGEDGQSDESEENEEEEEEVIDPNIITERDTITLVASRDYNPSVWFGVEKTMGINELYVIPMEVYVSRGNSGTGWMSLTMHDKKYCYQGNARSYSHIGDKFVLKRIKDNINKPCHERGSEQTYNYMNHFLDVGDVIKLNIDGGGFRSNSNCVFTEVELYLEIIYL